MDKEPFSADLLKADNTFIVEAHLYNEEEELSYSIKHIGSQYCIAEINLKNIESPEYKQHIDKIEYYTHGIGKKFKQYTMIEAWIESPLNPKSVLDKYNIPKQEWDRVPTIKTVIPAWSAFATR